MGRMHGPGKGISTSVQPYRRTAPQWAKCGPKAVEELIVSYAKKGFTPSQIGVMLRDKDSVPSVKASTGKSIVKILNKRSTRMNLDPCFLTLTIPKTVHLSSLVT
jgi:small subunit ribosomal protein S13e